MESLCQLVEQMDDPLQANKALNSIAQLAEISHPILQSSRQLLPRLLHLSKLTRTLQIKANALCVMRNLSRHSANKQEMFHFPGLVDLLVDTLQCAPGRCGETSLKAFPLAILSNLACDKQVRCELLANSALLQVTVRLAQTHKELKPIALQFIANMAISNGKMLLVCPGLIELLYRNRNAQHQCLRALGLLRFHELPSSEVPSSFNSSEIVHFWQCVRMVWAVRSACEVKRIGTRCAIGRLPKELCRMVFMTLHE